MARKKTVDPMAVFHVELPVTAIELANSFAATDDSRPVLCGLSVTSTEEGGDAWASDGFAAASSPLPDPATIEPNVMPGFAEPQRFIGQVLVPRKAILAAKRITVPRQSLVLRREGERWMIGQYAAMIGSRLVPGVWMTFHPIDGTFPDMSRMIEEMEGKATEYLEASDQTEHSVGLGADMLARVSRLAKAARNTTLSLPSDLGPPVLVRVAGSTMAVKFTIRKQRGCCDATAVVMPMVIGGQ